MPPRPPDSLVRRPIFWVAMLGLAAMILAMVWRFQSGSGEITREQPPHQIRIATRPAPAEPANAAEPAVTDSPRPEQMPEPGEDLVIDLPPRIPDFTGFMELITPEPPLPPSPFIDAAERPKLPERGKRTEALVLDTLRPALEPTWKELCEKHDITYPPAEVAILGMKDSSEVHIYARRKRAEAIADPGNPWFHLLEYRVLAASGVTGPKLREGDSQVPEGIYSVEYLNPNSAYHLSFKLDYPNTIERTRAKADGRDEPGSNIMIHGSEVSAGCLAMGDSAIEEIYYLVSRVGRKSVRVIIAPRDFRERAPDPKDLERPTHNAYGEEVPPMPTWTTELYADLHAALAAFPSAE